MNCAKLNPLAGGACQTIGGAQDPVNIAWIDAPDADELKAMGF